MSDENLMNLEDDTPAAPVAEAAPEAPPAAPVEAAAPETAEDVDLNAVDFKDEARIRGLIGELSRTRATIRELKPQAEKAQQLEQELNQAKPYVDFLRTNQHLLQPRPPEPEAKPAAAPAIDPHAEKAARLLDFYDPATGQLNLARGNEHLDLVREEARAIAQQVIQPLLAQNAQAQAKHNIVTHIFNFKNPQTGDTLKPEAIRQALESMSPQELYRLADENVAQTLAQVIYARQLMTAPRQPAPPATAPVVTEASGGRINAPTVRLSPVEEQVLKQRGMSPAKWEEVTKGFKPGVSNVLED